MANNYRNRNSNNGRWGIDSGKGYREDAGVWSVKRARQAADENRRDQKDRKFSDIPQDSPFFKKERQNHNNNNRNNNNRNNDNRSNQGNNNQRRDDRHDNKNGNFNNRNNEDRQYDKKRKMGVRGTDTRTLKSDGGKNEVAVSTDKLTRQREVLNGFVAEYLKVAKASGSIVDVLDDYLAEVCNIVKDYYELRFNPIIDEMNECIEIMTTKLFMSSLLKAMQTDMIDNWSGVWNDVARVLSIVLETSHTKMQDETINICVDDILCSDYVWKMDIDKLVRKTGITKKLATDLVIAIPVLEEDFTDVTLTIYCPKLLRIILDHAEDNVDVLMKEVQYDIFTTFFGKDRAALKIVGKYLDANIGDMEQDNIKDSILDEFYDMMYAFLDDFDIKDIEFVLIFLAKREKTRTREKEESEEKIEYDRVFDRKHAEEYSNISKALRNIDRKNSDLADYL